MKIEKVKNSEEIRNKIDDIFVEQAKDNNIDTNYQNFAYAVKNYNGGILGGIVGYRLFKEIHITDLSLDKTARGLGIGEKLIDIVENEVSNNKIDYIVLKTNRFQGAIDFYKKCGFKIEFIRENEDSRFDRIYMVKKLN
ncbi:MAG: GNAT family N-acetyltransferase [Crenarchaeota archaeon]|nr:GNAT family N-acetyltransferase [Thermoproteota archaeon]